MFTNPVIWVALFIGAVSGYFIRQVIASKQANSVEQKIKNWVEEAQTKAKEVILQAKDKAAVLYEEVKKEEKEKTAQLSKFEERLVKKEELLEKHFQDVTGQKSSLEKDLVLVNVEKLKNEELKKGVMVELERVAKLSFNDAKQQLLDKIKSEYSGDLAYAIQKLEQERRESIEKKSLEIITTAIQRYARSHVADVTTSVFQLPNEELKGKIIGREGRNIRTLERLTGVEVIVDETPDTVVLSSFDPLRREIARLALEKLIKDGRIQPAKIEEKVEESKHFDQNWF